MDYNNADVFVYQILDCLVTKYDYKIVNVPRNKKDIWLASETNEKYPMIRLNPLSTTSAFFEKDYIDNIKRALSLVLNKTASLLVINTNDDSLSFKEDDIFQVIVTDQKISDISILEQFPELSTIIKKVDNNQEECARLTKHLESAQMKKIKQQRKLNMKQLPIVTTVIAFICVIVYAMMRLFVLPASNDWISTLVVAGGYYKVFVVEAHEYWRILTTGFIHADILSLLFYLLALFQVGKICEKQYHPIRYLLIYLLSLWVGSLIPLLFDGNVISVGMGPGLYGVIASLLVYAYDSKLYKNRLFSSQLSQLVLVTFICFIFDYSSMYSLIGGFITGFIVSIILYPQKSFKEFKIHFEICGAILIILLGYFTIQMNVALPTDIKQEKAIINQYKKLGLSDYSNHLTKVFKIESEE